MSNISTTRIHDYTVGYPAEDKVMHRSKWFSLISVALLTLDSGTSAFADDTEVFYGNNAASSDPNILLVLDTSGSMGSAVTSTADYVPATTYSGSCDSSYVYYGSTTAGVPNCSTSQKIPVANFKCNVGTTAFSTGGYYQGNACSG